jgi:hypothetical protein
MNRFVGFSLLIALILLTRVCKAQYYYKDLVVNRENTARWRSFRDNHVKAVTLSSLEADGKPTEGFAGDQQVSADELHITTHSKSSGTGDSWIFADYSPRGQGLIRNLDTSDTYQNMSVYRYDDQGRLISISDTSTETDNHLVDVEQHIWTYDPAHPDKPLSMLKIMNGHDTTYVRFVLDAKGNVTEERSSRLGIALPALLLLLRCRQPYDRYRSLQCQGSAVIARRDVRIWRRRQGIVGPHRPGRRK